MVAKIEPVTDFNKGSAAIVWMDLEMSGLNVDTERILEMATLITNSELDVLATGPELVIRQPDSLLDSMDEWNQEHHGASGLIERVRQSTVSESQAAKLTLDFLKEHLSAREAPLAGNSVHMDRRFLQRYMSELEEFLHYRIIDVSSIKELGRRWFPEILVNAPEKKNCHRAMDDILESIEELRFYKRNIFRQD